MNQQQQLAIDYLREENRVLREQLAGRRVRLNDHQRRRLAAKAKKLGRRILEEVAGLVTPDTLMAWPRRLKDRCRRDRDPHAYRAEVRRKREPWTRATSYGR